MNETESQSQAPSAAAGAEVSAEAGSPDRPEWYPQQKQLFDPRRKSPLLAALLSLVPGLGQVYIGYYVRGLVTASIILMIILMGDAAPGRAEGPFILAGMFAWLFNIVDAGRMAALYNHAMAGRRIVELPQDFQLPRLGGSIAGGAVLMLFGAIALSHTLLGYPLEWIESWWPIFPLALGAYLLARGIIDQVNERERAAGGASGSLSE